VFNISQNNIALDQDNMFDCWN